MMSVQIRKTPHTHPFVRDLQSTVNKGTQSSSRTRWKVEETFLEETAAMKPMKRCPTRSGSSKEMQTWTRGCGCTLLRTASNKCQNANARKQNSQDQLVYKAIDGKSCSQLCTASWFLESGMYFKQNLATTPLGVCETWKSSIGHSQRIWPSKNENWKTSPEVSINWWVDILSFHLFLSWDNHARIF